MAFFDNKSLFYEPLNIYTEFKSKLSLSAEGRLDMDACSGIVQLFGVILLTFRHADSVNAEKI